MRIEKWFISNLDGLQRQIIVREPSESLIKAKQEVVIQTWPFR